MHFNRLALLSFNTQKVLLGIATYKKEFTDRWLYFTYTISQFTILSSHEPYLLFPLFSIKTGEISVTRNVKYI